MKPKEKRLFLCSRDCQIYCPPGGSALLLIKHLLMGFYLCAVTGPDETDLHGNTHVASAINELKI